MHLPIKKEMILLLIWMVFSKYNVTIKAVNSNNLISADVRFGQNLYINKFNPNKLTINKNEGAEDINKELIKCGKIIIDNADENNYFIKLS